MTQKFANAARAYLASTVSDSATTVTIDGGGSLFPEITSPDFSRAVLQDANGIEVVLITAHTAGSDTFTVTRGQEGTTARSFAAGSVFGIRMTSADGDTFVAKQDALVSGTNIKTVNGDSLLGSGNLAVSGGLEYSVKTANYTAVDKQGVLADTSGGAFTVTLPATPSAGAQVVVADAGNNWGTNNLTVGRNGSTIGGLAEDLVCNITGASVQFVYDGTTWEVYAQIGGQGGDAVTLTGTQTLTNKTIAAATNNVEARSAPGSTSFGFRNRIINGDMRIDQRNAGASVTVNAANLFFAVDRFQGRGEATDGVFTIQRSTTAPTGFNNSLLATVTTADASIGASQLYFLRQNIEGFNVADLGFGTAAAQTVTLSFVVRSSVTGTFSGSLMNGAANRSYPFDYTISAANTWEQKTVTIAGDTSGTWLTDNSIGLRVFWSLGAGSSMLTTANAWAAGEFIGSTGSTNLMTTSGATFYITGVQLEAGSVATPFERRDFGTELALCQRYFQAIPVETYSYAGATFSATDARTTIPLIVSMRAAPTGITTTGTIQFATSVGTGTGAIAFNNGTASAVTVVSSGASGLPSAGGCSLLRSSSGVERLQVSVEL
jgi:hypothetical protein